MLKRKCSIGIIDLSINNLFSIYKSCLEAGYKAEIINLKNKKINYDIVILPGVGAFKSGMNFIKKNNFDEKLHNYSEKKNSFIYGICLGMQLLFDKSYEFRKSTGLSFINGQVIKFPKKNSEKSLNLGWNKFSLKDKNYSKYFKKFESEYFYSIHSYSAKPAIAKNTFAISTHGTINFCSVVKKGKVFGTQFHPEKSGIAGIEFLKSIKELKS